jgi:Xaa-Pro aminopeptidase
LGLDIHEKPAISKRLDKEFKLLEGMVITIEPGLYIPGKFGFRYEDTVLVTADGYKKLTGVGIDN